ncbi:MAG: hypothetical protein ACK5L3_10445 [Oscillospiraceae bacterium]
MKVKMLRASCLFSLFFLLVAMAPAQGGTAQQGKIVQTAAPTRWEIEYTMAGGMVTHTIPYPENGMPSFRVMANGCRQVRLNTSVLPAAAGQKRQICLTVHSEWVLQGRVTVLWKAPAA